MNKIILSCFALLSLVACQSKDFTIQGTLTGVENGQVILQHLRDGRPVPVDTTEMVAGKFTFKGSVEAPELYFVMVEGQQIPVVVFVENSKITIAGSTDSLDKSEIKGSKSHDQFKAFNDGIPDQKRSMEIRSEYMQAQMTQDQTKMAALSQEMQSIFENQEAYIKKFVYANVKTPVGALMGMQVASMMEFEELDSLVNLLTANQPNHVYVKELTAALGPIKEHQKALDAIKEGNAAPAFSLADINGQNVSLESLKGKYVLVDFWASWCKPCREENPNVVKAYKAFQSKGFEVLSVSVDQDEAAWKEAVKADGLLWAQVRDAENTVAKLYAIQQIPTTFLLDQNGVIIASNLRGAALEAKLAELMP